MLPRHQTSCFRLLAYAGRALPQAFQGISGDVTGTAILTAVKHLPALPAATVLPAEDSLVVRTLLAAARQRPGLHEGRCRLVLDWLRTAAAVQAALQETLSVDDLTELKFSILVVLFTLEPESTTAADLAAHAGVTRAAVTGALDGLQEQSLVSRQRDTSDRRSINVHLTKVGHQVIDAALQRYLRTATHVARFVGRSEQAAASVVCAQLRLGVGGTA